MKRSRFLVVSVAALMAAVSCTTNFYDSDDYDKIISGVFPVTNVDASHNWNTLGECTANIEVNIESGKSYLVKVYENDPTINNMGIVMVQGMVENGSLLRTNFSHPQIETTFYVAIVYNGPTYVQPLNVDRGVISTNITATSLKTMKSTSAIITDEGFDMVYCFEDCFPEPGDHDYNDAVIGTKMIKTVNASQTKIELELELRAVGSYKQMVAALHISGLKEENLESVECNGTLFSYYANGMGNFYDENNNLMFPQEQPEKGYEISRQQQGDIYIPLTNDLHYSISGEKLNSFGMVNRGNYNTMRKSQKPENEDDATMNMDAPTVKGNVVITLKKGVGDRNITFKNFDLFIMEDYNGITWEIHTYIYKKRLVVFTKGFYENNIYPWALAIPGKGFRWPAEGIEIGSYRNSSTIGGAYQDINHSFGQWANNKNKAQDWYKHPTTSMVY